MLTNSPLIFKNIIVNVEVSNWEIVPHYLGSVFIGVIIKVGCFLEVKPNRDFVNVFLWFLSQENSKTRVVRRLLINPVNSCIGHLWFSFDQNLIRYRAGRTQLVGTVGTKCQAGTKLLPSLKCILIVSKLLSRT